MIFINTIEFFIKISKTEYINDLTKNGILYLTLAEEFRNKQRFGGKKFDSEEGRISLQNKLLIDIGNNNFCDNRSIIDFSNAKPKGNECIYCLKSILTKDIKPEGIKIEFEYIRDLIEENDWSEYSLLLIRNTKDFIDIIKNKAYEEGYNACFGSVEYDNHYFENLNSLYSDESIIEFYFHKRKEFEKQCEYRILLQNKCHEDLKLNIGKEFFEKENYIQIDNLEALKNGKSLLIK